MSLLFFFYNLFKILSYFAFELLVTLNSSECQNYQILNTADRKVTYATAVAANVTIMKLVRGGTDLKAPQGQEWLLHAHLSTGVTLIILLG